MTAFAWLLALTVRATLVLTVAFSLCALLRRGSALPRHRVFTLTAFGLLLLPILPELLPRWELAIVPRWSGRSRALPEILRAAATTDLAKPGRDAVGPQGLGAVALNGAAPRRTSATTLPIEVQLGTIVVAAWLVGVLLSLGGLVRVLVREGRLLATSRPLTGDWRESLVQAQRSLAVSGDVRLLSCEEIEAPLTGGWLKPAVVVPERAIEWTEERQRVVLQHELVHLVRRDGLRQLAWRLVSALYWFHPLVRWAARQATLVREEACDEAVVGLGHRPSVYAGHLLAIAESLGGTPRTLATALPMVERSQLERRLLVILDPNRSRSRGRMFATAALLVIASMVIGVGAAAPQAESRPVVPAVPQAAAVVSTPASEFAPGAACVEGTDGDFEGTFIDGPSGTSSTGTRNGEFVVQQRLGNGQRLCARVHGAVVFDERSGQVREIPAGSWVQVETSDGRNSRRMFVTGEAGEPRYRWWRNDVARSVDAAAQAWLGDSLAVVAGFRQIGAIHGQVGSLQGKIGSIQGEVGSLQGEIGAIQGEEGTLQGKVGTVQGEMGRLQGEIGSHQGAIGSLEGGRWRADAAQQARIDREIRSHQAAIAELEAEMASGTLSKRMAAAEEELPRFADSEGKGRIAEIERRIRDLHADERIARLEREIAGLHADQRIAEIERRITPALDRLKRGAQP